MTYRGVNALAESVIGLSKTEVIHRRPWRDFADVAYATLEWVAWFNEQRLLAPLGYLLPPRIEEQCYHAQEPPQNPGRFTEAPRKEGLAQSSASPFS